MPAAATLVLCGHGTSGRGGILDRHAARIRAGGSFADVRVCSLYGAPTLSRVLDRIATPEIRLVPWLMCAGFTKNRMREAIDGHAAAGRVVLSEPVGETPELADLAAGIAAEACRNRSWRPEETAILLIGHGSERNPVSAGTTRRHAGRIAAMQRFAAVATAFLDEPPSPAEALIRLKPRNCVAVGLFAERSLHGEADVPRLLGDDPSIAYTGPIGAAPAFADLIVAQAEAARPHRPRDAA